MYSSHRWYANTFISVLHMIDFMCPVVLLSNPDTVVVALPKIILEALSMETDQLIKGHRSTDSQRHQKREESEGESEGESEQECSNKK